MEEPLKTAPEVNQQEVACTGCGAMLHYAPGTTHLKCQHCGTLNEFEVLLADPEEIDFHAYLQKLQNEAPKTEVLTIKCANCAADTTFDPNQTAGECAFCASPLVVEHASTHHLIKPAWLLPFKLDKNQAIVHFRKWIKSLWFAPNNLAKFARHNTKLDGVYLPYWTYDCGTTTKYTGQRGIDYKDVEVYSTMENGRSVTKTRTVTKTRWYFTSGTVKNNFDDVLVVASKSLQRNYVEQLEPWNLKELVGFDEKFLSGFKAESYQTDLEAGFIVAKERMDPTIRGTICSDIGGDRQRIISTKTSYYDISFKHILLPVYVSSYRYKKKSYQIMVNGTTGEVHGERPYSWIKITLAVIAALIAMAVMFYVSENI